MSIPESWPPQVLRELVVWAGPWTFRQAHLRHFQRCDLRKPPCFSGYHQDMGNGAMKPALPVSGRL